MASLSDAVKMMEDYLTQQSSDTAKLVSSAGLSDKGDPLGQARNTVTNNAIAQVKAQIETNPIAQMGIDTANQMATTLVQKLVTDAFTKVNVSPIQNAVQNFFQAWASVSTLESEVAMELARNTANNINNLLTQKAKIVGEIQNELTALHNACIIILNSTPFFDAYLKDLVSAYQILVGAETKFKNVVKVLQQSQRYRNREFDSAVADLGRAQTLILPDRNADVSSIRGVQDLISSTIGRQTNQQARAAAVSIPGISLKIGQKVIEYTRVTTDINLLLNTYADALDGFIASFQRNGNIDQVTIDHINAGITQLADLINGMNSTLFPNLQITPAFDPTQITYGPKLSAEATGWGIKLQAIIEWMKLNPGKGSQTLDVTSNSVAQYINSKNLLVGFTYAGDTTTDSNADIITLALTTGITAGMSVLGAPIPPGTVVVSVIDSNSVRISKRATSDNRFVDIRFGGYGTLSYPGGSLPIEQSREDAEAAVRLVASLLLQVNTILATRQTRTEITARFRVVQKHFETSLVHGARVRAALQTFLNTSTSLQGPARQIVGQALGIANKYGLDRVVGLIQDGKTRELFNVTPDTATFSGAAVFGMNQLVSAIRTQPNVTDAQVERLETVRDTVEREKKAKDIEANRSYSSTLDAAQDELKAKLAQIKATIFPATEAAKQIDTETGTSTNAKAETEMANVIPGFNANRTLAGLQ